MIFGANENVRAYFVLEDGIRTAATKAAAPLESPRSSTPGVPAGRLQRMMLRGLGSLKTDKARKNVYHVAEGSSQVRRTIPIDNFFESESCSDRATYVSTVQPLVNELFGEDPHDSIVMAYGASGTSKMKLFHGTTLDPEYDGSSLPPQNAWGLVHYALKDIIPLAEKYTFNLNCTAVRIQIDSVVDGLVSPGSLRTTQAQPGEKAAPVKLRSQFQRLLALTNASALDIDSDESGRIVMADQVNIPIHKIEDFQHVINCFAAANSARILTKISANGALRASPFNYIITFRLSDAVNPDRNRVIHFAELADVDWTTQVPEDMKDFEEAFKAIISALQIVATTRPFDETEGQSQLSVCRSTMLTKILFTTIRTVGLKVALFSHAKYSSSLAAMEFIAKCRNNLIGIVLHGPDKEGENEVDPELRDHIEDIQKECDTLKVEIDQLLLEKRSVLAKIQSGDENMARLEQRRATLRRMTVASIRHIKNNDDEVLQQRRQQELMARIAHQQNCLRLQVLERELEDLAKEEDSREQAAKRQLKFINDEKERCQAKVVQLQKECDSLAQRAKKQQLEFEKEKQIVQAESYRKVTQVLDKNRSFTEKVNAALRKGIEEEQEAAKKQAQRVLEQEQARDMVMSSIAQKNSTINKTQVASGSADDVKKLEAVLTELRGKRQQLERERTVLSLEHKRQVEVLDSQAAVLGEYAFKMSSVLASIEKRVPTAQLLRIPVFEPAIKHKTEWLVAKCKQMRSWLEKHGSHNMPQIQFQIDAAAGTVEEINAAPAPTIQRPQTANSHNASSAPVAATSPPRMTVPQLRARLAADISRHNHNVEIAHASQRRLHEKHQQ